MIWSSLNARIEQEAMSEGGDGEMLRLWFKKKKINLFDYPFKFFLHLLKDAPLDNTSEFFIRFLLDFFLHLLKYANSTTQMNSALCVLNY